MSRARFAARSPGWRCFIFAIRSGFSCSTGWVSRFFPSSVYGISDIPAVINPVTVTAIALSAVVVCVLAALLPAINAARLAPARALRYE